MGIRIRQRNSSDKAFSFCVNIRERLRHFNFDKYGIAGVNALQSLTPIDSGKTADSWSYRIERHSKKVQISFYNSNEVDGVNIAIILQYGHATRSGTWVSGIDYINPALKKVFDDMAKEIWMEATRI